MTASVDMQTLKTTNEGSRFTTGLVWLVVRSKKPFGDTRLIVYSQVRGEAAWIVAHEFTVDPTWNMAAAAIHLVDPGTYGIKVNTSHGSTIAQATVHIMGQ